MSSHTADPLSLPDLEARLAFIGMSYEDREALYALAPMIDSQIGPALNTLYARIRKTPDAARLFQSDAHMDRARAAQHRHWTMLSEAKFDTTYAEKVRAVGEMHAKINLDLQWYIGGYSLILERLIQCIVRDAVPAPSLFSRAQVDAGALSQKLGALMKAAMLDIELATSVYVEAAERARRVDLETRAREQESVCNVISRAMHELSRKNLKYRIEADLPAGYQSLRDDFNTSVDVLDEALQAVGDNTTAIETSISEIAFAAADLSDRTEQQAASLESTVSTIAHISAAVHTTADHADAVRQAIERTNVSVQNSEKIVRGATVAMKEIENSSNQIVSIISLIDEIAFQTNLLALNAGVEAARAGDAGRGFAIVAQEVRTLAHRSTAAAKDIRALINTSNTQVKMGVSSVAQTEKSLSGIAEDVRHISTSMTAITTSAQEQSARLHNLDDTAQSLDTNTQQNAAMVEESTAACQSLANEAKNVNRLLEGFQLSRATRTWRHDLDARTTRSLLQDTGEEPTNEQLADDTTRIQATHYR